MIREVEAHHTTQAYDLEHSHEESMLKLECEALAEGGMIAKHLWRPAAQPCGLVPSKPMGY